MKNNFKTINLNKRAITIVFAALAACLILFLIIPWYHVSSYDYSIGMPPKHVTYYSSPLSITMGLGFPLALLAFVALITDIVLLMSDFYTIDLKHRRLVRVGSLILFAVCVLLTISSWIVMIVA